jgi:hypothetical protein
VTNLVIGVPTYTEGADVSASEAFDSRYSLENLIAGGRSRLGILDAAADSVTITVDVGIRITNDRLFVYSPRQYLKSSGRNAVKTIRRRFWRYRRNGHRSAIIRPLWPRQSGRDFHFRVK